MLTPLGYPKLAEVRGIMRGEAHAVGMAGQHLIRVKQKIERLVECDLVPAQQANASIDAYPLQGRLDGGGLDGIGAHPLQTQENGAVRAMTAAGQCQ